jgi:HD-like signal output (HDOD) protein
MAVSRLDSQSANIRAINAAKAVGRISRLDSILSRLATINHADEMAGPMLDRIIAADPILGQRVPLAVATYCDSKSVSLSGSLTEAVRSLGYPAIRRIVSITGYCVLAEELIRRTDLNKSALLAQAVAVASGSAFFATKIGQPSELAFSAGLFANIGVPTLANSEKGYASICASVAGGTVQLHEAEKTAAGCTHAETGYCLLTDYNFHEAICAAAAFHPAASNVVLIECVRLAEAFAHQLGFDGGFAIVPPDFDFGALRALNASEADAGQVAGEIECWNSLAQKF